MIVQIASLIIVLAIAIYYLLQQKKKDDVYFGKPRTFTKKEQKILEYYKSIYSEIPNDKRLSTLKRNGYFLEDIALTATEIIYDNPIPKIDEIENLKKGDLVKLVFTDKDGYVERMWIEYSSSENDIHQGILRNEPFEFDGLKEGSTIDFHSNNILEIDKQIK